MLQIISLLVIYRSGNQSQYPSNFHLFVTALATTTLRLLEAAPTPCITAHPFTLSLTFTLLLPALLLLLAAVAGVMQRWKRLRGRLSRSDVRKRATNAYGMCLFLVYPSVTAECLRAFKCGQCGPYKAFLVTDDS